jgi:hypothetical protein
MKREDEEIDKIQKAIYAYYSEMRCDEEAPTALGRLLTVLVNCVEALTIVECQGIISAQFLKSFSKTKEG